MDRAQEVNGVLLSLESPQRVPLGGDCGHDQRNVEENGGEDRDPESVDAHGMSLMTREPIATVTVAEAYSYDPSFFKTAPNPPSIGSISIGPAGFAAIPEA